MSLSPYSVVVFSQETGNVIPSASIEIKNRNTDGTSGTYATIYEDPEGNTPITQPGAIANSRGTLVFYSGANSLNAEYFVDGSTFSQPVDVGLTKNVASNEFALKPYNTLSGAITDSDLKVGDIITVMEGVASFYIVVTSGTGTTDNGLFHDLNNGLQIELIKSGDTIEAEKFGAVGDNSTDNTTAFSNAKNANVILNLTKDKTYKVGNVSNIGLISGLGVVVDATGQRVGREETNQNVSAKPAILDMHFGPLKGYGFASGESGGEFKIINITSAISAGDTTFTVASTEFIVTNQLMAFLSTDGTYFSGVVEGISGTTITMKDGLEKDVSTGNNLFNFYKDSAHPTTPGYNAITDYFLERNLYIETFVNEFQPTGINGGVVAQNNSDSYGNPGSSITDGWAVTATPVGSGAEYDLGSKLEAGNYQLSVPVNVGQNNTLSAAVISQTGGFDIYRDSDLIKKDSGRIYIDFFVFKDDTYKLQVFTGNGNDTFFLGNAVLTKREQKLPDLNKGTHVLLGDSWFVQNGIEQRLSERLPLAKVINKGIGGQIALEMSDRFGTDVTPYKPDFVWLMTGTNEYGRSVDFDLTSFYINKIKAQCAEIGAQLLIFNCSVGSVPTNLEFFRQSRKLATRLYLMDGFKFLDSGIASPETGIVTVPTTSVAAGGTLYFGFQGIKDQKSLVVDEHYFLQDCEIIQSDNLAVGVGIEVVLANLPSGYSTTKKTGTTNANRWLLFKYENTSGTTQTFHGYAKFKVEN